MVFPEITCNEGRILDQVQITGMLMSCVIGIYPSERNRKQPVMIDLCLYLDTRAAAKSANIADTIDYAGALQEISFILEQCEFLLIETAVEAICRHFLVTYQTDHGLPRVEAVVAKISKPSALTHGIIPAVQVARRKEDYDMAASKSTEHSIYEIHSSSDARLTLISASGPAEINVRQIMPNAKSILTIGKWHFQGQPIKSRSSILVTESMVDHFVCGEARHRGPKILLIHSDR